MSLRLIASRQRAREEESRRGWSGFVLVGPSWGWSRQADETRVETSPFEIPQPREHSPDVPRPRQLALPGSCIRCLELATRHLVLAPEVGFEPTTLRLTAGCSTIELLRIGCPRSPGADRSPHLPQTELLETQQVIGKQAENLSRIFYRETALQSNPVR